MGLDLKQILEDEHIVFSSDSLGKLEKFALLLHEWNQIHNLTGAKTLSAIYDNIVDSLYPLHFIETPESLF